MKIQTHGISAEDWDDFMAGEPVKTDQIVLIVGDHGDELHLKITDEGIVADIVKIDNEDSYVDESSWKTIADIREECHA